MNRLFGTLWRLHVQGDELSLMFMPHAASNLSYGSVVQMFDPQQVRRVSYAGCLWVVRELVAVQVGGECHPFRGHTIVVFRVSVCVEADLGALPVDCPAGVVFESERGVYGVIPCESRVYDWFMEQDVLRRRRNV